MGFAPLSWIVAMLDIEVIGTQDPVGLAKRDIAALAGMSVREFQHRGAGVKRARRHYHVDSCAGTRKAAGYLCAA
jgi:hypothetical protein